MKISALEAEVALSHGRSKEPLVSVVVLARSGLQKTQACLASVFATTQSSVSCEVIVGGDASLDGTSEYLHSLGSRVRILPNVPGKSLSEQYNQAAKVALGEFLCFLGDDATVKEGWLEKLLLIAKNDPKIGVVGNRHIDPETNRINHAGMVFSSQGKPLPLYHKQPADFWPALINQEFQILKATCWLVNRSLFLEVGGFDVELDNGYDDVDFCLRVRQRGYKCFYSAESVIYHAGNPAPTTHEKEARNWELFRCKWGRSITPDIDSFYLTPDRKSEVEVLMPVPVPVPPAIRNLSHIEERYRYVEALHATHPLIASMLRTIIRFATSTAKVLSGKKR